MATYGQQPNFQSYLSKDYQLPTQQIVQAIGARQNEWDANASKLKNQYQSYLNLNLSLPANEEKLNSYMQDVNNNLKKVVKTDLSLDQNADEAMKIFDPIIKDKDLQFDNLITKHYQFETQKAQSLRIENKGIEYSDTNVGYMLKPYQEYIKSNDPSNGRQTYYNKRFYQPYHDVSAEQKELYKNFKPDVTKFKHPDTEEYIDPKDGKTKTRLTNSGYMVTQENKGIVAAQYRAYLNANLSDKAKGQLHIDGVMAYGDNIHTLANDYIAHNTEQIDSYTQSYNQAVGDARGTSDLNLKSQLESKSRDFLLKSQELKSINNALLNGDLTEVQKNKESIAGELYSSNYIEQLANASKRLDITTTYDPDVVALTKFKEGMQNQRTSAEIKGRMDVEEYKAKTALELEQYKLTHTKGANGEQYDINGNIIVPTSPNTALGTELNNENFGQKELDKLKSDADSLRLNSFDYLNDQLSNVVKVNGKHLFTDDMNITQKKAAFDTWANEKNDKGEYINHRNVYNTFQNLQRLADIKQATYQAINENINNQINNKVGTDVNKQKQDLIDSISKGSTKLMVNQATGRYENLSLTKEELIKIAKGDDPNMKITKGPEWVKSFNPNTVTFDAGATGSETDILNYNGKKYEIGVPLSRLEMGGTQNTYNNDLDKIVDANKVIESKTSSVRNEIVNKAITRMKGIEDFQDPGAKYLEPVRDKIVGDIGVPGIKRDEVKLISRDNKGGLYFKLIDDKDESTFSNALLKQRVESLYGSDSYIKADNVFYIQADKVGSDILKPRTYTIPGMDDIKTLIDFKNSNRPDNKSFSTPPFKIDNEDFQIITNKVGGQPTYTLMHSKSGAIFTQLNDTPFLNIEEATLLAKKLMDLKAADSTQFIKMIKTKGGQPNYTGQ